MAINPKQEQAYIPFSGEMKCGKSTWRSTTPELVFFFFFESNQRLLAWKLKRSTLQSTPNQFRFVYVSLSGEMKCGRSTWRSTPSKSLVLKAKNGYVARKLHKGDCLRFVLRENEGYLRRELIYKVKNSCFRENLVQMYF